MSVAFGCDWLTVSVTTPQSSLRSIGAREQIAEHLLMAERLGAESHTIVGENIENTLLEFAQSRNVTKIVVGQTAQSWWQRLLRRGIVDRLLERSSEFLTQSAGRQLSEMFSAEVVIFLRKETGIELRFGQQTSIAALPVNAIVAQWVTEHSQVAGARTDTLPNATALFVPLVGSQQTVGAIGVKPNDTSQFLEPEQRLLLETCASLVALAIKRDQSILDTQGALVQVQTEQLRNSLLSSVSHDLRTQLTSMAGSASSLLNTETQLSESTRRELVQSIIDESHRLSRLVENLLDITRLESGGIQVKIEWHVLEEILGSALHHVRKQLTNYSVNIQLPPTLPLVYRWSVI